MSSAVIAENYSAAKLKRIYLLCRTTWLQYTLSRKQVGVQ